MRDFTGEKREMEYRQAVKNDIRSNHPDNNNHTRTNNIWNKRRKNTMKVRFVKNHQNAKEPVRGSEFSAGWDLTALSVNDDRHKPYVEYDLGVSMEIPSGYVGLLFPRSSVTKMGMSMGNCVGIIDSDYRGPVKARFYRGTHARSTQYKEGERVCQLIIMPFPEIEYDLVNTLSNTERGEGGFGSTGSSHEPEPFIPNVGDVFDPRLYLQNKCLGYMVKTVIANSGCNGCFYHGRVECPSIFINGKHNLLCCISTGPIIFKLATEQDIKEAMEAKQCG